MKHSFQYIDLAQAVPQLRQHETAERPIANGHR